LRGSNGTTKVVPFPSNPQIGGCSSLRRFAGESARATLGGVDSVCISDPSQTARGDSGDAEGDVVFLAKFARAVFEQAA